jgi:hypothetical protein
MAIGWLQLGQSISASGCTRTSIRDTAGSRSCLPTWICKHNNTVGFSCPRPDWVATTVSEAFWSSSMRQCGYLAIVVMCVALVVSGAPLLGQDYGFSSGEGPRGSETESGFGPSPYFTVTLNGDFVVAGQNTRATYFAGSPPPQTEPVLVVVSGIPDGSTVTKALANWSCLTRYNSPYP